MPTTTLTSDTVPVKFGSDRVLLYTASPWKEMGFGVPNFGDNVGTVNLSVHNLADEVAKLQLLVMTHVDATRTQPPSANTMLRLMKMLNRVQSVLTGRQKADNVQRTEPIHASPDMRAWLVHPVPYFESGWVRNHWLKEYNMLTMIALTNIYQHSDNNLALTITERFAKDIYAYFRDILILVGVELLGKERETVEAQNFKFNPTADILEYVPDNFTINYETLDTPGPIEAIPTEDDLRPFVYGIPSTIIKNYVAQYPTIGPAPGEGYSGSGFSVVHAATGTIGNEAVSKPGGTIGLPTI